METPWQGSGYVGAVLRAHRVLRFRAAFAHPKEGNAEQPRDEHVELPAPYARDERANVVRRVRVEAHEAEKVSGGGKGGEDEGGTERGDEEEEGGDALDGARVLENGGPLCALHIVLVAALVTLCDTRARGMGTERSQQRVSTQADRSCEQSRQSVTVHGGAQFAAHAQAGGGGCALGRVWRAR